MTIEILYFDGCPNHEPVLERLRELVAQDAAHAEITLRRVETDEEAQRLRFLGSPTVRVDGRDVEPGADAREDFGLRCRLYQTGDALAGAPAEEWLMAALGANPAPASARSLAAGLIGQRSARDRLDGVPPAHRRLHQRVLRAFVDGQPTGAEGLARWAAELDVDLDAAVAELERHDVLWCDHDSGGVAVAYPFSGRPTPHRVRLNGTGIEVFAMCAIDALGVPYLADQRATITSRDPTDRTRIRVRIDPGREPRWEPTTAGVTIGFSGEGPSATCCCPHLNFIADSTSHTEPYLELPEAIDVGRRIFASLLDQPATG